MLREPNKRRFFDAINHVESEEIALFEFDPDMAVVNQMRGQDYPLSLHTFNLPIKDQIALNRVMGGDMVYFSHMWRVGRKEWQDADGRIHYTDGMIKTPADINQLWFPDIADVERRLNELLEGIHGTGLGLIYGAQVAPFTSATAIGFEDFCIAVIENPVFVTEVQNRLHEYCLKELEMALTYPIDVVKLGSGLTANSGAMLSPAMMETFEFSRLREMARMTKDKHLPLFLHIDGRIVDMIPDFIAMGVDIINPIEPCGGAQDIFEIKHRFGNRVTLCGNIDINGVLVRGSPEDVRREVTNHIERLAGGGGYIVSSSHNLHELIPVENFFAMRDAVHAYKRRAVSC